MVDSNNAVCAVAAIDRLTLIGIGHIRSKAGLPVGRLPIAADFVCIIVIVFQAVICLHIGHLGNFLALIHISGYGGLLMLFEIYLRDTSEVSISRIR